MVYQEELEAEATRPPPRTCMAHLGRGPRDHLEWRGDTYLEGTILFLCVPMNRLSWQNKLRTFRRRITRIETDVANKDDLSRFITPLCPLRRKYSL